MGLSKWAHYSAGIAGSYDPGRDVRCDDRASTNDASTAYRDALQNDAASSHEHIIFNVDRRARSRRDAGVPTANWLNVDGMVIAVRDYGAATDEDAFTNADLHIAANGATADPAIRSYADGCTASKRGKQHRMDNSECIRVH